MITELKKREIRLISKVIILDSIAIFIIAALFHFLFNILNKNPVAAIFFPVNESIFEHLKLALYPTIIVWMITYLIMKQDYKLFFKKWIIGMTVSILTCILFIVCYYYVLHYAFNIGIPILDILSLLAGSFLGQALGCHIYNRGDNCLLIAILCVMFLILLCILFANCTFYPPKLPLFIDPSNGTYGI